MMENPSQVFANNQKPQASVTAPASKSKIPLPMHWEIVNKGNLDQLDIENSKSTIALKKMIPINKSEKTKAVSNACVDVKSQTEKETAADDSDKLIIYPLKPDYITGVHLYRSKVYSTDENYEVAKLDEEGIGIVLFFSDAKYANSFHSLVQVFSKQCPVFHVWKPSQTGVNKIPGGPSSSGRTFQRLISVLPEEYVDEFFNFLIRVNIFTQEEATYFKRICGHRPVLEFEQTKLSETEVAISKRDYEHVVSLVKEIHASVIEENRKKKLFFTSGTAQNPGYVFDHASAAFQVGKRLLALSPKHASQVLSVLKPGSPYFKKKWTLIYEFCFERREQFHKVSVSLQKEWIHLLIDALDSLQFKHWKYLEDDDNAEIAFYQLLFDFIAIYAGYEPNDPRQEIFGKLTEMTQLADYHVNNIMALANQLFAFKQKPSVYPPSGRASIATAAAKASDPLIKDTDRNTKTSEDIASVKENSYFGLPKLLSGIQSLSSAALRVPNAVKSSVMTIFSKASSSTTPIKDESVKASSSSLVSDLKPVSLPEKFEKTHMPLVEGWQRVRDFGDLWKILSNEKDILCFQKNRTIDSASDQQSREANANKENLMFYQVLIDQLHDQMAIYTKVPILYLTLIAWDRALEHYVVHDIPMTTLKRWFALKPHLLEYMSGQDYLFRKNLTVKIPNSNDPGKRSLSFKISLMPEAMVDELFEVLVQNAILSKAEAEYFKQLVGHRVGSKVEEALLKRLGSEMSQANKTGKVEDFRQAFKTVQELHAHHIKEDMDNRHGLLGRDIRYALDFGKILVSRHTLIGDGNRDSKQSKEILELAKMAFNMIKADSFFYKEAMESLALLELDFSVASNAVASQPNSAAIDQKTNLEQSRINRENALRALLKTKADAELFVKLLETHCGYEPLNANNRLFAKLKSNEKFDDLLWDACLIMAETLRTFRTALNLPVKAASAASALSIASASTNASTPAMTFSFPSSFASASAASMPSNVASLPSTHTIGATKVARSLEELDDDEPTTTTGTAADKPPSYDKH